jgi:rfaE bifunctional protein nucleotidyltransferase chain/domain
MTRLEVIEKKIFTAASLKSRLAVWKFLGKKIVFTNGCFDILHLGHVDYLAKAADEGDILVLGVNTDKSIGCLKGPGRPINNETQRSHILASLQFVDAVILFDEETPYELIRLVEPDVLVKGADYEPEKIVGYDLVKARGGVVKTIDLVPGYSTTAIAKKIRG